MYRWLPLIRLSTQRLAARALGHTKNDAPGRVGTGAAGADDAALHQRRAEQAYLAALGDDLSQIGDAIRRRAEGDLDIGIIGIHQRYATPRREQDLAAGRGDDAAVLDIGRNQINAAALRGPDGPLSLDAAGNGAGLEASLAGEKIAVRYPQRRSDQPLHIDTRGGAEQYPVRVDQPDAPIGLQRAQNRRRLRTEHPVENAALRILLEETRCLSRTDGEPLPVDDRAGGIGDGQSPRLLRESGTADDDLRSDRQCECHRRGVATRHGNSQQARPQGQASAQSFMEPSVHSAPHQKARLRCRK